MLVATDLDCTLLRSDGSVSEFTRGVLSSLDEAGVPVIFVTARPLRWMEDLWPIVGKHGMAVLGNGAIWYDVPSRTALQVRGIEPAIGLQLTSVLARALPGVSFAIECIDGIRFDHNYVADEYSRGSHPRGSLEDVWTEPATKLLVQAPDWDPATLRKIALEAVGDIATVTWTTPHLLEISAAGVTKSATLQQLLEHMGLDRSDLIAFGDMPNDVDMIELAGQGFAVANADETVKRVADEVVGANDDDGVARKLEQLFGLRDPVAGLDTHETVEGAND